MRNSSKLKQYSTEKILKTVNHPSLDRLDRILGGSKNPKNISLKIYHWKAHKLLYILHISDLPDGQLTCLRSVTYAKAFSLKAGTIMNCSFGYLKIFDRSLWHSSIEIQNVTLSRFVPLRLSVMMNLFWIILDKHNFSKIFRRELYTSKLSRLAKKFTLSNIYPNL